MEENEIREIARTIVREEFGRADPAIEKLIYGVLKNELGKDYKAVFERIRAGATDSANVRAGFLRSLGGMIFQALVSAATILSVLYMTGINKIVE